MFTKKYIDVVVLHSKHGTISPVFIIWEDGTKYSVEKILQVIPKSSLKVNGDGIRYTCKIHGKIRYLFFEQNKWFIETK